MLTNELLEVSIHFIIYLLGRPPIGSVAVVDVVVVVVGSTDERDW